MADRAEEHAGVADVDLSGSTILVTGSTDGIGRETALALGRLGATVLVHGRDRAKGESAVAALDGTRGTGELYLAEFASLDAVRDLADGVIENHGRLDVLVNNAGAYFRRGDLTDAGVERTFAVNHLAPFLLTNRLRGAIPDGGRVVTVSSAVHRRVDGVDPRAVRTVEGYDGMDAYARSKLANVLFTAALARRLDDATANCLHPGSVPGSALWRDAPLHVRAAVRALDRLPGALERLLAETPASGAATSVYLAAAPDLDANGAYFVECEPATPSPAARDREAARELWELSAELTGVP